MLGVSILKKGAWGGLQECVRGAAWLGTACMECTSGKVPGGVRKVPCRSWKVQRREGED